MGVRAPADKNSKRLGDSTSVSLGMLGVHLQDAAEHEAEIPPGQGEVDFKLVAEYLPSELARVVEVNPRHGRAEILAAVRFLLDLGI